MTPGTLHRLDKLTLVGFQSGIEQQLGHPEYTIHRRANFVAHCRQKLTFRAAPRFCQFLGGTQLAGALLHHLLETAEMRSQPTVTLTNLLNHGIETLAEQIQLGNAGFCGTRIQMPP